MTREDISHEITLQWEMTGDSWDHWVRGLGQRTPDEVVMDGLREIRENVQNGGTIAKRAKSLGLGRVHPTSQTSDRGPKRTVAVTVASRQWQLAMSLVDGGEQSLRSE